jgi:transposase-like protein
MGCRRKGLAEGACLSGYKTIEQEQVMASSRRKFPRAFKISALRRLENGDSMGEVARFLKVDTSVLMRWRRDYERAPESAFPGPGRRPRETGIAELRRRIERHTEEIDHLIHRIQNAGA